VAILTHQQPAQKHIDKQL